MNRSKRTAEMSSEDKSALLNDAVFYEIIFALGVSDHDPSDYCVWEHLNFSRMGHARALIYFFECPEGSRRWPDDAASKPWPHTILNRIHERCVEFVQFFLSPKLPSEISPIKSQWQALLNILQSGHELRITRSFDYNDRDSGWMIGTGRSLGSGLAELTPLIPKHAPLPSFSTTET